MASQFNGMEDFYDKMEEFFPFRADIEVPSVLAAIGDAKGKRIMDFGCGPGVYCRAIKKHGAAEVVGYDLSEEMVRYAKERETRDPLGITYTTELTSAMDGQFDLVLCVYVLPYASTRFELNSMFTSLAKVLRPAGHLIGLPIHPEYESDRKYYEPYGFRLVSDKPYEDGGAVTLKLCQGPEGKLITAFYWSKVSLEHGMLQAGFDNIRWLKLTCFRNGPIENAADYLCNYIKKPHAAMFECQLKS